MDVVYILYEEREDSSFAGSEVFGRLGKMPWIK